MYGVENGCFQVRVLGWSDGKKLGQAEIPGPIQVNNIKVKNVINYKVNSKVGIGPLP